MRIMTETKRKRDLNAYKGRRIEELHDPKVYERKAYHVPKAAMRRTFNFRGCYKVEV